MATWNKRLQSLNDLQLEQISIRYLMGWHDFSQYGFRLRGLNSLRKKRGLSVLDTTASDKYRITYIHDHFTQDEIRNAIEQYLMDHRVAVDRWVGIEILDCRFGREYARLFKKLLGSSIYREISEKYRRAKLIETQMAAGGVGLGNPAARLKMERTVFARYGVSNPMQRKDCDIVSPFVDPKTQKKARERKALNLREAVRLYKQTGVVDDMKRRMSQAEFLVFMMLADRFGKDDVFYSYGIHPRDDRYPFNCDFYIRSMDLFIELNFHYSHGSHWYDENNHDDRLRVKHLLQSGRPKAADAVHVWTVTDVEKRAFAKKNGLRYLVFWDGTSRKVNHDTVYAFSDFRKWFYEYDCDYDAFVRDFASNSY